MCALRNQCCTSAYQYIVLFVCRAKSKMIFCYDRQLRFLNLNLAGWLAGWLVGRLAGWPTGWLAGWLAGWPASWSAG